MLSELFMGLPNKALVAAFQSQGYVSSRDVYVLCASGMPFLFPPKYERKELRSGASKKAFLM